MPWLWISEVMARPAMLMVWRSTCAQPGSSRALRIDVETAVAGGADGRVNARRRDPDRIGEHLRHDAAIHVHLLVALTVGLHIDHHRREGPRKGG